jgi:hypothetical protein
MAFSEKVYFLVKLVFEIFVQFIPRRGILV